jgi:hypothetical protein
MSGTFPEGLGLLPYLQEVDFRYNEMNGPLPANIATWKNLLTIEFKHCAFTGTIPDLWFGSHAWTQLLLEGNQLTGTLSSGISKLEDLKDLSVVNNKMIGNLITEIGNMLNLRYLELDSNGFNGPIPKTLGKMSRLITLDLSRNFLTGTIPEDIAGCSSLVDMYMFGNLLTGTIPQTLWDMTNLMYIKIGSNALSGTISNKLSKFGQLAEFEIENNEFNGTFPFRLGNTDVRTIRAYGNKFDGNVSNELCTLVDNGKIKDLEFDCATPLGGGTPEIFCPDDCCTVCCNSNGEDCVQL